MYIAILHIRECSLIEAYPNYAHSESKANALVEAIIDVHVHYTVGFQVDASLNL